MKATVRGDVKRDGRDQAARQLSGRCLTTGEPFASSSDRLRRAAIQRDLGRTGRLLGRLIDAVDLLRLQVPESLGVDPLRGVPGTFAFGSRGPAPAIAGTPAFPRCHLV